MSRRDAKLHQALASGTSCYAIKSLRRAGGVCAPRRGSCSQNERGDRKAAVALRLGASSYVKAFNPHEALTSSRRTRREERIAQLKRFHFLSGGGTSELDLGLGLRLEQD